MVNHKVTSRSLCFNLMGSVICSFFGKLILIVRGGSASGTNPRKKLFTELLKTDVFTRPWWLVMDETSGQAINSYSLHFDVVFYCEKKQ